MEKHYLHGYEGAYLLHTIGLRNYRVRQLGRILIVTNIKGTVCSLNG